MEIIPTCTCTCTSNRNTYTCAVHAREEGGRVVEKQPALPCSYHAASSTTHSLKVQYMYGHVTVHQSKCQRIIFPNAKQTQPFFSCHFLALSASTDSKKETGEKTGRESPTAAAEIPLVAVHVISLGQSAVLCPCTYGGGSLQSAQRTSRC